MRTQIASWEEANKRIEEDPPTHLISINDKGMAPLKISGPTLALEFNDIEEPGRGAPTIDHAIQIIWFAEKLDEDSSLLVHCMAGISRSTAATLIVWMVTQNSDAWTLFDQLFTHRPIAFPNILLLEHGCKLLNRPDVMRQYMEELPDMKSVFGRRHIEWP